MSSPGSALWAAAIGAYAIALVAVMVVDAGAWISVALIGALPVGLALGSWKAAAAALVAIPAAMLGVALGGGEPAGDATSGPLETGLLLWASLSHPSRS